ncbi:hypothetical protein SORBI_3010G264450 [Sorghum bicolor]|uniref:Uncharacterized protein n=1 Tax=Sorghum bicolor TaxID=4558 RepID=A0A1W0VUZ3_SORBI|nr:hypothetical protein SORBI_3010G264450 [Sorghum bicolor]
MVCLCLVAGMEEYMELQRRDQQLSTPKLVVSIGCNCMHVHLARSVRTEKGRHPYTCIFLSRYACRPKSSRVEIIACCKVFIVFFSVYPYNS